MSTIFVAVLILALIKIIRDNLFYLWLWQIKEYRLDRMISYLKDEKNIAEENVVYLFCLALMATFYFYQPIFVYLTAIFFTFVFYQIILEIRARTLKRPQFTFKVTFILFSSLVFYFLIFAICHANGNFSPVFATLLLLFFYLIIPVLVTVIVLSINPVFNFQKKRIIKKATVKIKTQEKVKVIGITGSYGKTSTKEFLYTILRERFKVVKTEGNNNTNIGVARTVLEKLSDDCDYFVCEMGAYKIGEIAEICGIVKPKIGILTGINEQHVDLFGGIENTIKAKFELIEALPKRGRAIINEKLRSKKEKEEFLVENVKYFSNELVREIKNNKDGIEFTYKDQEFKVSLLGVHYIENLLAAIITAEKLGMSLKEISEAVKKIEPTEFTMRKSRGLNDSIFIDDSYSANPDGVIAALNYLDEAYKNYKKIIVFPGIIELGSSSKKVHQKLYEKIGKICNVAYIIRIKNQESRIKNTCEFIFEDDFNKLANLLKKNLDEKTVVLFESRGAGVVMKKLLK